MPILAVALIEKGGVRVAMLAVALSQWETEAVALEEIEARELGLEDRVGETDMDWVPAPLREPLAEEEGEKDKDPLPHGEELPLEEEESEWVALEQ